MTLVETIAPVDGPPSGLSEMNPSSESDPIENPTFPSAVNPQDNSSNGHVMGTCAKLERNEPDKIGSKNEKPEATVSPSHVFELSQPPICGPNLETPPSNPLVNGLGLGMLPLPSVAATQSSGDASSSSNVESNVPIQAQQLVPLKMQVNCSISSGTVEPEPDKAAAVEKQQTTVSPAVESVRTETNPTATPEVRKEEAAAALPVKEGAGAVVAKEESPVPSPMMAVDYSPANGPNPTPLSNDPAENVADHASAVSDIPTQEQTAKIHTDGEAVILDTEVVAQKLPPSLVQQQTLPLNNDSKASTTTSHKPIYESTETSASTTTVPTSSCTPALESDALLTNTKEEASSTSPTTPIESAVPILRGSYEIENGVCAVWKGKWSMSQKFMDEGVVSDFCYKCAKLNGHTSALGPDGQPKLTPVSGVYDGYFDIMQLAGPPMKVNENGIKLTFTLNVESEGGNFDVVGTGKNGIGHFDMKGSLMVNSGILELRKVYRPAKMARPSLKGGRGRKKSAAGIPRGKTAEVAKKVATTSQGRGRKRVSSVKAREAGEPLLKIHKMESIGAETSAASAANPVAGLSIDATKLEMPSKRASQDLMTPRSGQRQRKISSKLLHQTDRSPVKLSEHLKKCLLLVNNTIIQPTAEAFREPVDPVKFGIPDYFKIIKNPMDLGTIKTKLETGGYFDPEGFADDIRLTFKNCMKYNKPPHQLHYISKTMLTRFEEKYREVMLKLGPPKTALQQDDAEDGNEKKPKRARTSTGRGGGGRSSKGTGRSGRASSSSRPAQLGKPGRSRNSIGSKDSNTEKIDFLSQQLAQLTARLERAERGPEDVGPEERTVTAPKPKPKTSKTPSKPRQSISQKKHVVRGTFGEDELEAEPMEQPLTHLEKRQLSQSIHRLPDDKLTKVVQIIQERMPNFDGGDTEDMEIEIDALSTETLRHLQRYVQTVLNSKKKKRTAPKKKPLPYQTEMQVAQEVEAQLQANIERKKAELDALDNDNQDADVDVDVDLMAGEGLGLLDRDDLLSSPTLQCDVHDNGGDSGTSESDDDDGDDDMDMGF